MDHPDTRLEQMMLRVFLSSCCHVCTLASGEAIVYGRDAVCPKMFSMQPFKNVGVLYSLLCIAGYGSGVLYSVPSSFTLFGG